MTDMKKDGDGQNDLAILFPDIPATLAGRSIVMREYTFIEGVRLARHIAPIVDAMAAMALSGELTDPENLRPVFADNTDHLLALMAAACDQPVDWVASLDDSNGRALQLLWWSANAHFFGRRVVQSVMSLERLASLGDKSTLHSPERDTTTRSPGTRVVN